MLGSVIMVSILTDFKLMNINISVARSAGVEPATARFVAEYSIQLSYERVKRVIIARFD